VISSTSPSSAEIDISALTARLKLLEEENCWLKAQLFGRSSEKSAREDIHPDQAWLFNEAEALAAAETAPIAVTIHAYQRLKHGRKKLDAALPRVDVVHDIPGVSAVTTAWLFNGAMPLTYATIPISNAPPNNIRSYYQ
jgi:hypothetical protein